MKKSVPAALLMILSSSSAVLASGGVDGDGTGIMAYLFLGFLAMFIATQLVPGATLFIALIKGLFGKAIESKNL